MRNQTLSQRKQRVRALKRRIQKRRRAQLVLLAAAEEQRAREEALDRGEAVDELPVGKDDLVM